MFPFLLIWFVWVPETEVTPIRQWLPELEKLNGEARLERLLANTEQALKEHPDQAYAGAQLAVEWSQEGHFAQQQLRGLFLLGQAQRDTKQIDQAIDTFEGAWLLALRLDNHEMAQEIHPQLSSTLYHSGDYERTMAEERRFLAYAEDRGDREQKAQSLNDIGVLFKKMGNLLRAEDYHQRALTLRREIKDVEGESQSLGNLGILLKNKGEYSEALFYQLKAIELIEVDGKSKHLVRALNNVGIIYKHLGDYREAIDWHVRALEMAKELDEPNRISNTLSNLADNHIQLEEYDKAETFLQQSQEIREQNSDIAGLVYDLVKLATVHLKREQLEEAKGFLARAEEHVSGIDNTLMRALVNQEKGVLARAQGDLEQAIDQLNLALDDALLIQNRPLQRDIYRRLVDVYRDHGNPDQALVHQTKFIELHQELVNTASRGKIANIQAKYDMEKARQELEILRKDRKIQQMALAWQKLWRNVVMLAILFLVILAVVLYNRFRIKNRAYEILSQKSEQISQQKVALEQVNGGLRQKTDELEEMNEQLYRASVMDSLTGVYNRTFIMESLEREVNMSNRHHLPMAVLMVDLDYFKGINDRYGHQAGDEVLRSVAMIMSELIRREDLLARYGGEEFIIALPNTTAEQAMRVAEKIREGVATHTFEYEGIEISVGISVGMADIGDLTNPTLAELIRNADEALYRAKENGRNQTVAFAAGV